MKGEEMTDREKYLLLAGFIYGAYSDSKEYARASFCKDDALDILTKVGFMNQ